MVSHPYDAAGGESNTYEVLTLSESGEIAAGESFRMGRAQLRPIVFTPGGRVGIVPQQGGSLGVFRLDDHGRPIVVHEDFRGSFFASSVVMQACGDRAWVLDTQWAMHGGGIYAIRIHPDGTLRDDGCVVEAKLPYLMCRHGSRHVLAGYELLGARQGFALHVLDLTEVPRRVGSIDAFGDREAIGSSLAVTSDGRYALVGDNNGFSNVPNRISVISLEGDRRRPIQAFTPMLDPVAIVTSPWGGPVLVVSGFGNAIHVLDYDPSVEHAPFSYRGELEYVGDAPGLPSCAVCVEDGSLAGRVLIAESGGIRQVDFVRGAEGVIDRGLHGLETAAGALGVQQDCRVKVCDIIHSPTG